MTWPVPPDIMSCNRVYGSRLISPQCRTALGRMSSGNREDVFSVAVMPQAIKIPLHYYDNDADPECVISIDMAGDSATFGHTATNDSLAQMARGLISGCVESRGGIGGFMTFGLGGTIDDLSEVSGRGIYGGLTEPLPFMTVMVSGPDQEAEDPGDTDPLVNQAVIRGLWDAYYSARSDYQRTLMAEEIARLQQAAKHMITGGESRWYDLDSSDGSSSDSLQTPINVNYDCDATLGSPNVANCEAAEWTFFESGPVVLDPIAGPIIKIVGNCAISVASTKTVSTTWDLLQGAVDSLVALCISGPRSSGIGGTAISSAVSGKRDLASSQTPLPLGIEVSIYMQDTYSGPANETCAYGIVNSHVGDVRTCPAVQTPPARPNEANPVCKTGGCPIAGRRRRWMG